ncbi:MAG: hypothetical protein OCD76_15340 [Reichenbachiella sp.]
MKCSIFPKLGFLIFLISFISSCKDSEDNSFEKHKVDGLVQKGPYVNGSSIIIYELSSDLLQTGKVFSTKILDNSGAFSLRSLDLQSTFAIIEADGFYFNEITASVTETALSLNAIVDLSESDDFNVNVLTHMAYARVQYLVDNGIFHC